MFLRAMSRDKVTVPAGIDWKGLGYIVSILSVGLLGAVAWPKAGEPGWHAPVLAAGMTASILGIAFRYLAHLKEQKELRQARDDARQAKRKAA
jgi:hypothetical protein